MPDKKKSKGQKLQPWLTEANNLNVPNDVNEFGKHLLLETRKIVSFLHTTSSERDSKFLIVAPKGYGKTLLLKLKKAKLLAEEHDTFLIPPNLLIDRPTGAPDFSDGDLRKEKVTFWKNLWMCSITLSVLHALDREALTKSKARYLKELYSAEVGHTPSDIFTALLQGSRGDLLQIESEWAKNFMPYYAAIHRPVAIFIDNIDDFFDPETFSNDSYEDKAELTVAEGVDVNFKERARKLWTCAQIGLAESIRELRGRNRNIKVFAAIRKEALERGVDKIYNKQKVDELSLDLTYTADELKEIFKKNILLEKRDRLASPSSRDPVEAFVGAENKTVVHSFTGRREEFLSFVLRHTMGRPRDLAVIGKAISDVDPIKASRVRPLVAIQKAVYDGAKSNVLAHFTDMKTFLSVPDIGVLRYIHANVLVADDLEKILLKYSEGEKFNVLAHPFCALYRVGLLGVIALDAREQKVQKFQSPDSLVLDRIEHILPSSEVYLIHPALDEMTNDLHGVEYRINFQRVNIVGNGLPWAGGLPQSVACQGDIVNSSHTLFDPIWNQHYPPLLRKWVQESFDGLRYHRLGNGDQVKMVDSSPIKIVEASQKLVRSMNGFHNYPRSIRFGASLGVVEFNSSQGTALTEPSGFPFRTAARLESLSRENCLLVDDAFMQEAIAFGFPPNQAKRLTAADMPTLETRSGEFIIQKKDNDPAIITALWEIDLLQVNI